MPNAASNKVQEIKDRDNTISEKEKRIYDLKRKNQELEKFKFVLDHKIKELKKQIEPKDDEIADMREQIKARCLLARPMHVTCIALLNKAGVGSTTSGECLKAWLLRKLWHCNRAHTTC